MIRRIMEPTGCESKIEFLFDHLIPGFGIDNAIRRIANIELNETNSAERALEYYRSSNNLGEIEIIHGMMTHYIKRCSIRTTYLKTTAISNTLTFGYLIYKLYMNN